MHLVLICGISRVMLGSSWTKGLQILSISAYCEKKKTDDNFGIVSISVSYCNATLLIQSKSYYFNYEQKLINH